MMTGFWLKMTTIPVRPLEGERLAGCPVNPIDTNSKRCHATGAAHAPVVGDTQAWMARNA
jgi:cytochrome c5